MNNINNQYFIKKDTELQNTILNEHDKGMVKQQIITLLGELLEFINTENKPRQLSESARLFRKWKVLLAHKYNYVFTDDINISYFT